MLHFSEGKSVSKRLKTVGWLCKQTGYSRMQLNRLAQEGEIPGERPRSTSRSHRRFEDSLALRAFVRRLRDQKRLFIPKPKRVRLYVREDAPAPLEPPASVFAAAVRQVKNAKDASIRKLANLMATEELRIGKLAMYEVLQKEGVSRFDVRRAEALLTLPHEIDKILENLTCEHALVVVQAKHLTQQQRILWLQRARSRRLTPLELRKSIEVGRVNTLREVRHESGHNSGIRTIQGITYQFILWKKEVNRVDPLHNWSARRRGDLLEAMEPMSEFIKKLTSESEPKLAVQD